MSSDKSMLHQVLAVEPALAATATAAADEVARTFKRPDRFKGQTTILRHFDEDDKRLDTDSAKPVDNTVMGLLDDLCPVVARAWDATMQKEVANQHASADVQFGVGAERVTLNSMPATALLALEHRLKALKKLFDLIPTLPVGQEWERDPNADGHVFRARESDVRFRTEKQQVPLVLHEGNDKHAPQVQMVTKDRSIGKYTDHLFSGAVSAVEKAKMLARLDEVLMAVQAARQQANCAEVHTSNISMAILNYITRVV